MFTDDTWRGGDESSYRCQSLRELLEARRRGLAEDVQRRMTRIREGVISATPATEPDPGDTHDLDLSLLEIAVTTLRRVDCAIEHLDAGRYGRCVQCHGPIGDARLRAVPFAVCCQQCENAREQERRTREPMTRQRRWTDAEGVNAGVSHEEP
jgi:RNA polymerase-binding transcription factor DksA